MNPWHDINRGRRLTLGRHGRGHDESRGHGARHGGGDGTGDDEFSRGRKFNADDLQTLLLALLMDAPRHGYELMRLLEIRSNGFYVPSPGMVYPALTYVGEIGYATVLAEGTRKRYSLTVEGRAYVAAHRERIEVLWAKLDLLGKKMGLVRRALAGEDADGDQSHEQSIPALLDARHALKHHLFSLGRASVEEQLRIANILKRALAEIIQPTRNPKDH